MRVLTISVTAGCMHANPPEIETNREAKDENTIRQPKSLLWKMQKSTSYFKGKLRLLYKMKGLDSLYDKYKESIELETRVRQPSMRAPEEGEQFHYHLGGPLHKSSSQNSGPI